MADGHSHHAAVLCSELAVAAEDLASENVGLSTELVQLRTDKQTNSKALTELQVCQFCMPHPRQTAMPSLCFRSADSACLTADEHQGPLLSFRVFILHAPSQTNGKTLIDLQVRSLCRSHGPVFVSPHGST